jgi:hypothetical protein
LTFRTANERRVCIWFDAGLALAAACGRHLVQNLFVDLEWKTDKTAVYFPLQFPGSHCSHELQSRQVSGLIWRKHGTEMQALEKVHCLTL